MGMGVIVWIEMGHFVLPLTHQYNAIIEKLTGTSLAMPFLRITDDTKFSVKSLWLMIWGRSGKYKVKMDK